MANQEHLEIFHQGTQVWNAWRKKHPEIKPDLSGLGRKDVPLGERHYIHLVEFGGIDYYETNLRGFNFSKVNLSGSKLPQGWNMKLDGCNFNEADLSYADLNGNKIFGAMFRRANLFQANFSSMELYSADFSYADLRHVNLSNANLSRAHLFSANLKGALLLATNLSDAEFHNAHLDRTVFGDLDLSSVRGLEAVEHKGPSYIDIRTIYRSKGKIPEDFLRNAGIPESFITYAHSLVAFPIDYYTCFISYSSKDQDFAERLYADLRSKGVRCWFAPHDLKTGDRYRDRIDESIRLYDKLLLILSEHAVTSTWVEQEVEAAMEKERILRERGDQRTVLFPIKLDDTVMQTTKAWAADVRRRWHIGDFIGWHDYACYQRAFTRLLRDLKSEASHSLSLGPDEWGPIG